MYIVCEVDDDLGFKFKTKTIIKTDRNLRFSAFLNFLPASLGSIRLLASSSSGFA